MLVRGVRRAKRKLMLYAYLSRRAYSRQVRLPEG